MDLLSVHLIRNVNGSTIISYHPAMNTPATTAKFLHERIRFAGTYKLIGNLHFTYPTNLPGQSVYWQSMFQKSRDPTLVLLTSIWHASYAWDEALEHLYEHICSIVSPISCSRSNGFLTYIHTGKPRDLNWRNVAYPRTSYHQLSSSSLPLPPRTLHKTCSIHQKYSQPRYGGCRRGGA